MPNLFEIKLTFMIGTVLIVEFVHFDWNDATILSLSNIASQHPGIEVRCVPAGMICDEDTVYIF